MGATLPSRSRGRSRRAPMSEINVTPLVDVMLVLLIIFIDDVAVSNSELSRRLAALAAEPAPPEGRRIYLRADRSLDYGRVMRVMGELNRAGLNRVALVSVGEEQ